MRCGNLSDAEHAARAAVGLGSSNPSTHALLGEILARQGRYQEAEAAERKSLALAPAFPQATLLLAGILQDQGRFEESLACLEAARARGLRSGDLCFLRARALLSSGRASEAQSAFRELMQLDPGNAKAAEGFAAACLDAGDVDAGEATLHAASKRGHVSAESTFLLARAAMARGHYEMAEGELRSALRMRTVYPAAQTNLAELVWMRTGDLDAATRELNEALRADPRNTELRVFKAKMIEWAVSQADALEEIESGLALEPGNRILMLAAAQTGLKCDPPKALAYAEQLVRVSPREQTVLSAYASALLACGQAGEAAVVAERMRSANPLDGNAIALLASAWRALGDGRYRRLYDYERSVWANKLDVPQGWSSLQDYLVDLGASLQRIHTLTAHPIGQTLRRGSQIDLTSGHMADVAIRAFIQAIDGPIRRYMDWLGKGEDWLRVRNTGNWKLGGIWSVRLRATGFHVNHYHPDGWLSSACYIDVPPGVGADSRAGWIQFGQPGIPMTPMPEAEYFVRPEPGLLVLFPSWMWHGTVPFAGNAADNRLTIAFDVLPAT